MSANVVEVLVKAANMTGAGFAEAKAGAEETAASMDTLAAANDRVTAASVKYAQAQGGLLDAQLRLAEVEDKEGATAAEISAARDKVTAATLRQADAQITLLNAEAKQEAAASGASSATDVTAAVTSRAAIAQARFTETQKAQTDAAAALAELQKSGTASTEELTAATGRLTDASVAAAGARRDLATMTKTASDEQAAAGVKARQSGALMAGMGAKMKMAGLGVAVGMGMAVKSAADFQKQTVTLVTSAGESTSQLGTLQQGILSLSSQTATSAGELTRGLYTISSAGITGAGGLSVLKAAAEGAKSEGADLGEVTNALTSGINAYGMRTKTSAEATVSATSMMNQMLATVSSGKMTFQELAGSLSSVLPIAAANRISYAQVGGALATMTSMGVSAQQGTQDLAFSIRSLANPTSVATKEMAAFGINSTDVSSKLGQRGLTGTIQLLSDAVTSRMGRSGLVIQNAMNQSKSAAQDAQIMLGKLPVSIQGVAKAYLDGTLSQKQWTADLKGMPALTANLAHEFATTAKHAHSFNDLLKGGSPAAQTYAAAMSKMLGGATGLNVGLMLTGQHAATFNRNVKAIGAAANGASGQVSGFGDVQKTTAFQLSKASDSVKAMGTSLGLALLPAVNAVLKPLASFFAMLATHKAAAIAFAVVVGGVLAGAVGVKAVHALTDFKEAAKTAFDGLEAAGKKIGGLFAGQAAEADAAATETAAANEGAAASSSGSWVAAAGRQIAAGVAWVAQNTAKLAIVVAENVAGAVTTAAAWVAANAVMLLGIGAVVALVAVAVVEIVKHWKSIVHGVEEAFDAVKHAVLTAVDWVVKFVKQHWDLLVGILAGPIGLAVALIVKHWDQIKADAEKFAHDVTSTVSRLAGDVLHFFERMFDDVTGAVRRGISVITGDVRRWFGDFLSIEQRGLDNIVHFFEQLPGRIVHALGDVGSLLLGSGEKIIQGLINGIGNMVGSVEHAVSSVVDDIKNFLPFSPAKKGPLSGAGAPENSGRSIARLLASGISSGAPAVSAAMRHLAGSAAGGPGVTGGLAVAGAGGVQRIELILTGNGSDSLLRWLRQEIRVRGGSVQSVLGTG